jgi:hypothetical protein
MKRRTTGEYLMLKPHNSLLSSVIYLCTILSFVTACGSKSGVSIGSDGTLKGCDAKYGAVQPVVYMDGALHPPKEFSLDDVCSMGHDLSNVVRRQNADGLTAYCKRSDDLGDRYNELDEKCKSMSAALKRGDVNLLDAEVKSAKEFCQQASFCGPSGSDRQTLVLSGADKSIWPMFSVGKFNWNGKQCTGYLQELQLVNDTISYRLYGIADCGSYFKDAFEKLENSKGTDSLFTSDGNPEGMYIGDYLIRIGYTGKLPGTFKYNGIEYPAHKPRG